MNRPFQNVKIFCMTTVSDLSKTTGVSAFTIRHYTRIGLLKPARDPRNGYKLYRPADAERLRFIVSAKELGFTLGEIAEILHHADDGDSPCPMVRELIDRRIDENRERIREMKRLQKRLESAAELWSAMPDSQPNGHSVCRLIESFAGAENRA